MHRRMAERLNAISSDRGSKINVLGPRGGAKSTLATLAYPLRTALEGRESYIWIVSDTKPQAHAHLENLKAELLDKLDNDRPWPGPRKDTWLLSKNQPRTLHSRSKSSRPAVYG
ncbi:MAG: hypothetical protein HUU20_22565 [Pirellulales bacterium]|nr:hypothetical protein [Pirellulales bacterium]